MTETSSDKAGIRHATVIRDGHLACKFQRFARNAKRYILISFSIVAYTLYIKKYAD